MASDNGIKLVFIASSTGGPKALHKLLPSLNERLDAPVVVVQHMPKGFTISLAKRLDGAGRVYVHEAVHNMVLEKGHVYIARAGQQLKLGLHENGDLFVLEEDFDVANGLKPCANVTLSSICQLPIDSVLCVILTGMGEDGCEGVKELKKTKLTYLIAQDKKTCTVYGMPKAVIQKGLADMILPLEEIGEAINNKVGVF